MGRPKSEDPHDKQFRIRLTEDEMGKLRMLSSDLGMDISKYIRFLVKRDYERFCVENRIVK